MQPLSSQPAAHCSLQRRPGAAAPAPLSRSCQAAVLKTQAFSSDSGADSDWDSSEDSEQELVLDSEEASDVDEALSPEQAGDGATASCSEQLRC